MLREGSRAARLRLALLIVIVPFALLVASVGYSATALPGCGSCHERTGLVTATRASSHANVLCTACHVSPKTADRIAFGFRQVFHMAVPIVSGDEREWASVPNDRCLACHKSVLRGAVSSNGITIVHSSCAKDVACTTCHSMTAHGKVTSWPRTYDMETCLACHASTAKAACDTCHTGRSKAERVKIGTFWTTHGPNWKQTHGMGNPATCSVCHTAAKCEKCHGAGLPHDKDFLGDHPAVANSTGARCSSCHEQSFCDDCHGLQMPHATAFTRDHGKLAKTQKTLCDRCHVASDCKGCHEAHVHPGGSVNGSEPLRPWKSGS